MLIFALAAVPAGGDGVDGDDFTVYLSVASDYVFRGSSQTREKPAVQLGVEFEHESGLFAGIWGSNVEFPPLGPAEDPRDVEVQLYGGYGFDLGRGWALSAALARYEYPGAGGRFDWDYTEGSLALLYRDGSLSLSRSESALGSSYEGLAVEVANRWQLPAELALLVTAGYYDLRAPFLEDYAYWSAELSRPFRWLTLMLGYFDTDSRGEELWGDRAAARLVAGASFRIH